MSQELSAEKEIIKIERKLLRDGQENFVSEVRGMTENELNVQILILAKHKQEIITAQKNDPDLKEAKDVVSSLNYPYNKNKRANDEKSRFISLIFKDKYGSYEDEAQS